MKLLLQLQEILLIHYTIAIILLIGWFLIDNLIDWLIDSHMQRIFLATEDTTVKQ